MASVHTIVLVAAALAFAPSPGSGQARMKSLAGGGVDERPVLSWQDVDGDGLPDALVLGPDAPVRLLWNRGEGMFEAELLVAGIEPVRGASFARWTDVNGDEAIDLLLGMRGGLLLLCNDGRGGLEDRTSNSGLPGEGELDPARVLDAGWLDFDRDGRPDLQLTTSAGVRLYRNSGATRFERIFAPAMEEWTAPAAAPISPSATFAEPADPAPAKPAVAEPPVGVEGPRDDTSASGAGRSSRGARASRFPVDFSSASLVTGESQTLVVPTPTTAPLMVGLICATGLRDAANPNACIAASSSPTLGSLYPQSIALNVSSTGKVGMGTVAPEAELHVFADGSSSPTIYAERVGSGDSPAVHAVTRSSSTGAKGLLAEVDNPAAGAASVAVRAKHLGTGASGIGVWSSHDGAGAAVYATSATGSGVLAVHTSTLGFAPAVSGTTASEANFARGVWGSLTSANPGTGSAAVFGQNNGTNDEGSGVEGLHAGGGTGVYARSITGYGVDGWHSGTTGTKPGVRGLTNSVDKDATAVEGLVTSTAPGAGSAAVRGTNQGLGVEGAGVVGRHTGTGTGVHGSSKGVGVFGLHDDASGVAPGVQGETNSIASSAVGVLGRVTSNAPGGFSAGVFGENLGLAMLGIGVYGRHRGAGYGVHGKSINGRGIYGNSTTDVGVYGLGLTYGVFSNGDMGGTGAKYFVQPHPTDASKEIRFVSLEGNESGTYFRGSTRLEHGRAVVEVPEEFRLASERKGLTVQVTARGPGNVWVERVDLESVVIRGEHDLALDYFVNGVRRGFADLEPMGQNRAFVPTERGVPYGAHHREGLRRLLVENGTLNADFTPNEETARRFGWKLRDAVVD